MCILQNGQIYICLIDSFHEEKEVCQEQNNTLKQPQLDYTVKIILYTSY